MKKIWYAVIPDREDAYIAILDISDNDPMCIGEIERDGTRWMSEKDTWMF